MTNHATDELELPSTDESQQARDASQALARILEDTQHSVQVGTGNSNERFDLPESAARLLLRILSEMATGNAVTMVPVHAELSTQEAASLLNVSRPHLVKLLEQGEIDYHKVGVHRRVQAQDVLAYQQRRTVAKREAREELTAIAADHGLGY